MLQRRYSQLAVRVQNVRYSLQSSNGEIVAWRTSDAVMFAFHPRENKWQRAFDGTVKFGHLKGLMKLRSEQEWVNRLALSHDVLASLRQ